MTQPEWAKNTEPVNINSLAEAITIYKELIHHLLHHHAQGSQQQRGMALHYLTWMYSCLLQPEPDFRQWASVGVAYIKSVEDEYLDVPDWWRRKHHDVASFVWNLKEHGPSRSDTVVRLARSEALVLFGWLARTLEGQGKADTKHPAEERALVRLHSNLKSSLMETTLPEYPQILDHAREQLARSD